MAIASFTIFGHLATFLLAKEPASSFQIPAPTNDQSGRIVDRIAEARKLTCSNVSVYVSQYKQLLQPLLALPLHNGPDIS